MDAFTSLSVLQLPSPCRLLAASCCPDKDLVVLVSRLAGQDRISLWKIHGYKIWETELTSNTQDTQDIPSVAWSPDGQTIAVAHNPPRISVRSIQDGREERDLSVPALHSARLTGLWWFRSEQKPDPNPIPDLFKRNNIITGSAHSVLKMLPLLDNIQEDSRKNTATNLFAFQGSQTRAISTSTLPDFLKAWPTLPSDPLLASLSVLEKTVDISGEKNEVDDGNKDSILAVSDDQGNLYPFLDGTFPLGAVHCPQSTFITSLQKHSRAPLLFAHNGQIHQDYLYTDINPTIIEFPLLNDRRIRNFAQLSSTARELVWFVTRLTKEMREAWLGSDTNNGVRKLGSTWVHAMEERQREQFGHIERNAVFELTALLTTGRASNHLQDFLIRSEHMSERSIQKWDSTMSEALIKLRDYSEKRIAPALQRLHLVLEEIKGWSQLLPEYSVFQLQHDAIVECTMMNHRGIMITSWLAAAARREYLQFKEFMTWLRFETLSVNAATETPPPARHDIIEVNYYLMTGLVSSPIDKWFLGPIPTFNPSSLGLPESDMPLSHVLARAKEAASDPKFTAWPPIPILKDKSLIDRNLDNLIQQLGISCQRIFDSGSRAPCRAAVVLSPPPSKVVTAVPFPVSIRDRISFTTPEASEVLHYYTLHPLLQERQYLCICRKICSKTCHSNVFEFVILACNTTSEPDNLNDLLDVDFFDDQSLVVIYREKLGTTERGYIGLASYSDLPYRSIVSPCTTREQFMELAIQKTKEGDAEFPLSPLTVQHRRRVYGCDSGASIAVNGTRKFASLLDSKGLTLECIDLEIEASDEDDAGESGNESMPLE